MWTPPDIYSRWLPLSSTLSLQISFCIITIFLLFVTIFLVRVFASDNIIKKPWRNFENLYYTIIIWASFFKPSSNQIFQVFETSIEVGWLFIGKYSKIFQWLCSTEETFVNIRSFINVKVLVEFFFFGKKSDLLIFSEKSKFLFIGESLVSPNWQIEQDINYGCDFGHGETRCSRSQFLVLLSLKNKNADC